MNNTIKIFNFNRIIHELISNSELDIGTVYFILKNTFREIESLYYEQLNKELMNETEKSTLNEKDNVNKEPLK